MPMPWLRILDLVIGVTDLARSRKMARMTGAPGVAAAEEQEMLASTSGTSSHLETRLAGVVVAALKEAFERDTHRLELEREQLAAERERAERALRLELFRQAIDREIGRMRLLAGVAAATWIGTLILALRLAGSPLRIRATLGGGWVLIIAAIAAAFFAQSQAERALDSGATSSIATSSAVTGTAEDSSVQPPRVGSVQGTLAVWLLIFGLLAVATAVLLG